MSEALREVRALLAEMGADVVAMLDAVGAALRSRDGVGAATVAAAARRVAARGGEVEAAVLRLLGGHATDQARGGAAAALKVAHELTRIAAGAAEAVRRAERVSVRAPERLAGLAEAGCAAAAALAHALGPLHEVAAGAAPPAAAAAPHEDTLLRALVGAALEDPRRIAASLEVLRVARELEGAAVRAASVAGRVPLLAAG